MSSDPTQTNSQTSDFAQLRARAEQGDAQAQLDLGMYYNGKDHVQAAKWLGMAAAQGDADAKFYLRRIEPWADEMQDEQAVSAAEPRSGPRPLVARLSSPLTLQPALVAFMLRPGCLAPSAGSQLATVLGSGPLEGDTMRLLVAETGILVAQPSTSTEIAVIGEGGWTAGDLDALLQLRQGESLRVYSQQMFFAWASSGRDPLDPDAQQATVELAGPHPALEFLRHVIGFDWPSTAVRASRRCGKLALDAVDVGYLAHEGYRVGKNGLPSHTRHSILQNCYVRGLLPYTFTREYAELWGTPGTSRRLQKIAESIASFCRFQKLRSTPSFDAIEDWEDDLAWLRETYCEGQFRFAWPDTRVW